MSKSESWTSHELMHLGPIHRELACETEDKKRVVLTHDYLVLEGINIDLAHRLVPETEDETLDFCEIKDTGIDFNKLLQEESEKYHKVVNEIKESVVRKTVEAMAENPAVLEYVEHGKFAVSYYQAKKAKRKTLRSTPEYKRALEYFRRTRYLAGRELVDNQ